jgi:soluble lytic murein transglycosylase-like protein
MDKRIRNRLWLAVHATLVGGITIITSNHIEANRAKWERDLYLRRLCETSTRLIPADLRCLFVTIPKRNDPRIIAAVALQESGMNPRVCSKHPRTGKPIACGLMQFVPGTAKEYNVQPFDPASSIDGADRYLTDLRKQFGNYGLALAAYNCGPRCVSEWLAGRRALPQETRQYVSAITGHKVEDWRGRPAKALTRAFQGHVARMDSEFH